MIVSDVVCAGIVTYNPDLELLQKNIDSIKNQVHCLIIFDNGSKNVDDIRMLYSSDDKVFIIGDRENKGIAYALNRLCAWALENKYQWILTLDQDSISPPGLVDSLKRYANQEVAIVAPNIKYKNNESFIVLSNKSVEEVRWVITSASLTNLRIWKKLEGFDEWLFIDGVDYDYCIRANNAGYKVLRVYQSEILHELGELKCFKILGKTIYVTNHSAFRKYFMSRNTIYLKHKLNEGHPVYTITKYLIKTIVFEDNKIKKIASIIQGTYDGFKALIMS